MSEISLVGFKKLEDGLKIWITNLDTIAETYGIERDDFIDRLEELIKEKLVEVFSDGGLIAK